MNEARWRVRYVPRAQRDLRRLDPQIRARVLTALERLAADDPSIQERKLNDAEEWRIRVGDWRVRFRREFPEREIVVLRVLPRGRAYR
ncbi:MAG: type II toxin-antitoxin system RelE family toxin [Solirubrobacterales bacterium]